MKKIFLFGLILTILYGCDSTSRKTLTDNYGRAVYVNSCGKDGASIYAVTNGSKEYRGYQSETVSWQKLEELCPNNKIEIQNLKNQTK